MSSGSSPKMKDVADRCGVSESTVSHALNGTKKVAAQNDTLSLVVNRLRYDAEDDNDFFDHAFTADLPTIQQ